MLEFVKTFDLQGSIIQFLQERRRSLGISDSTALHPRLVNQEKGGLIIYTWNDQSEDVKVVGPVTHVGVYDPGTQKHKVLWIYNQKVRIVSCSLNRERTLLGFTIVTRQDSGQEGKSKDVYQAFLAELQSLDTRVFSLNLQRHAYLKVQFLYPDASPSVGSGSSSSSGSSRQSHMLVMLHKESIGLYQIHMARIGDRGIMMSGQPSTEQIVRKFVWCQWDTQNQRLYYIHNVRQSSSHAEVIGQKLSAVQFHSGNKFDNMIDVPINFPFPSIRTSTRLYYTDIPLHQGIPDATLNATVLSQANGSLCLCYQEYTPSAVRPKSATSPLNTQKDQPDTETVNVNYYVCMVHHAKTLHGSATGLPRSVVAGRKVIFQWFGDYLVVSMPGVFCHLLNVNVDYEPCHHILLHNHDIPIVTKPPVPSSSGNSSQTSAQIPSGSDKSSITTTSASTDTSDPAQDQPAATLEITSASQNLAEDNTQSLRCPSVEMPAGKGTSAMDAPDLGASSSQPLQSLSPASAPVSSLESPTSPLMRGLGLSPRGNLDTEDMPTVLSAIDRECFRLGKFLAPCYGFCREAGLAGTSLYDSGSGCILHLASNSESLVRSFKAAYWGTKLAILHHLIMLRTRDLSTIRQVFEVLTADPTAPETTLFLSEFLVASTFASMRKKSDRETTQLLTFTAADTFRGQFEKSSTGERLARITYISLDSVNISTKASRERRRRGSEDNWDLLRRSLRLKIMPPPARFSHEHVLKALHKDFDRSSSAANKKWVWVKHELEESFFEGMHTVKLTDVPSIRAKESTSSDSGGRQSRTETVLGPTPLFLQALNVGRQDSKKRTEQLLVSHLIHHLKKESRIKAQNIAHEYIISQNQQSQLLCHLLWSIHMDEETEAYKLLLPKLDTVGTDKEYQLFQLYERVFHVTQDLAFPRPPGFPSFFTALGFKCLTSSLFLQYVDRGILQLTPDFVLQLLQDLPDSADPSNAETKFHIISRLPKPFAEDCFQRWHHPVLLHLTAQQQVAQVLQEGLIMSNHKSEGAAETETVADTRSRSVTSADTSTDALSFKPLSIFIRHLEDTAMEVQRQKPTSSSLMYDTRIIEEAALSFTRNHTQYDLSSMNF